MNTPRPLSPQRRALHAAWDVEDTLRSYGRRDQAIAATLAPVIEELRRIAATRSTRKARKTTRGGRSHA